MTATDSISGKLFAFLVGDSPDNGRLLLSGSVRHFGYLPGSVRRCKSLVSYGVAVLTVANLTALTALSVKKSLVRVTRKVIWICCQLLSAVRIFVRCVTPQSAPGRERPGMRGVLSSGMTVETISPCSRASGCLYKRPMAGRSVAGIGERLSGGARLRGRGSVNSFRPKSARPLGTTRRIFGPNFI